MCTFFVLLSFTIKSETVFQIQRGINVASWLSTPKYFGESRKTFFQESDVQLIASMGFDHIRLCVDETTLWTADGVIIRPYAFDLVHDAIQWCDTHGLKVIFDLHVTRNHRFTNPTNLLFDDENEPAKFVKLWEDISSELSQYPNSLVAYELLNEPVSKDPADWNRVSQLAISAIRAKEPERTIIVGVCTTNGVVRYDDLTLPEDRSNLMMTFHYYGPFLLTAYGLQSTTNGRTDIPISYPGRLISEEYIHLLPGKWQETGRRTYDRERLKTAMSLGFEKAAQLGVPVFVGEFGTLKYLPNPARANWYIDVVSICKEFSAPYTSWDYKGYGYSIVSEQNTILYPEIAEILKGETPSEYTYSSYYVKNGGNNSLSGSSWENALASIIVAIERAGSNDTIKVSEGVFNEGQRIYVDQKHVILQGGYDTITLSQDYSLNKKTIITGNNAHQILRVTGTSGSRLTLNNFILQNGNPIADKRNGAAVESYSPVSISNCVFRDNVTKETTYNDGGAVHLNFSGVGRVVNCEFYNNESSRHAGALNSLNGTLYVVNCTFTANKSAVTGGAVRKTDAIGDFYLQNSILWGNSSQTAPEFINLASGTSGNGLSKLSNNIIKGGINELGGVAPIFLNEAVIDAMNINPLFVSETQPYDLRLSSSSPAINAGNNELIKDIASIDIIGRDRIQDTTVDLGCYEENSGTNLNNSIPDHLVEIHQDNSLLHVKIDESLHNSAMTLVDITGRVVLKKSLNKRELSISTSNLKQGIYIIKIKSDKGELTRKNVLF